MKRTHLQVDRPHTVHTGVDTSTTRSTSAVRQGLLQQHGQDATDTPLTDLLFYHSTIMYALIRDTATSRLLQLPDPTD